MPLSPSSREGPEHKTSTFRAPQAPGPSKRPVGGQPPHSCARQEIGRSSPGLLGRAPPPRRVTVSWPPFFLLMPCRASRAPPPLPEGPWQPHPHPQPQPPPGSRALPARAESKQAQENNTCENHRCRTKRRPRAGAQTPACLARRIGPVMSDMCSVVCEPATPQQLAWPGPRFSGRILHQAELPAPGTHGARPLPLPARPEAPLSPSTFAKVISRAWEVGRLGSSLAAHLWGQPAPHRGLACRRHLACPPLAALPARAWPPCRLAPLLFPKVIQVVRRNSGTRLPSAQPVSRGWCLPAREARSSLCSQAED